MSDFDSLSEEQKMEIVSAARKVAMSGTKAPDNMYHPDYGWIIRNGNPTAEGAQFIKDLEDKNGQIE